MQALHQKTLLLATDLQRSVLNVLDEIQPGHLAYTPYGHRAAVKGLLGLPGFNGEQPDPLTGHYHLGNGYRQFNPVLMRFNSPDSWSPFGKGGLNAYVYCLGDPVNRIELNGQSSIFLKFWKGLKNRIGVRTPSKFDAAKMAKKHANDVSTLSEPPPLNSDKTYNQLKPKDLADDDLDLAIFEPVNSPATKLDNPDKRSKFYTHTSSRESTPPLAPGQYENYLNNALGSANHAPLGELISHIDWLSHTPGPSSQIKKLEHTTRKIRKNIYKRLNQSPDNQFIGR
jgi:RHS repeat-associated protein